MQKKHRIIERLYITLSSFRSALEALRILRKRFIITLNQTQTRPGREECKQLCRKYDAMIIGALEKLDKNVLCIPDRRLKLLGVCAVGLDNIDLNACKEQGIIIESLPHEVNADSVAEFTVAGILAAAKRLKEADRAVRERNWNWRTDRSSIELKGRKVGVVGAGAIGKRVITRLSAFGVQILCHTLPDQLLDAFVREYSVRLKSLSELVEDSDIITLHIPLNRSTHHLIGVKEFNRMKKDVIFVNTSRGAVVDEVAMYRTLKSRKTMVAVIDVFENEPRISQRLTNLPNILLSPHVAGSTKESWIRKEVELVRRMCMH